MVRVIGIDYDTHRYHCALLEEGKLTTFETEDMADSDESVMLMAESIVSQLGEGDIVFAEMPIHIQNPNTTLRLSKAFAFLNYACMQESVEFRSIRTGTWKKIACGKGNFKKPEVLVFAKEFFGDEAIENQHLADAACMALAGLRILADEGQSPLATMCDADLCLFWKENPDGEEKFVRWTRTFTPLKGAGYRGTCNRPDGPVIGYREYHEGTRKIKLPVCKAFSDKEISGHLDMSRFLNPKSYPIYKNLTEI